MSDENDKATPPPAPDATTPTPETEPDKKEGKLATFTQEHVNHIAAKEMKRGEESAIKSLLTELNLDDANALKDLVAAEKARKEAEMSATEKLQAAMDTLTKERDTLLNQLKSEQQERVLDRRDVAILTASKDANDANDVLALLKAGHAVALAAVVNGDGVIDEKAVVALVEKFKSEKPHLFASSGMGSPSLKGGKTPKPDKNMFGDKSLVRF